MLLFIFLTGTRFPNFKGTLLAFMVFLTLLVNHTGILFNLFGLFLICGIHFIWASIIVVLNNLQVSWRDLTCLTFPFNFLLMNPLILEKFPLLKLNVTTLGLVGKFLLMYTLHLIVLWSLFPSGLPILASCIESWEALRITARIAFLFVTSWMFIYPVSKRLVALVHYISFSSSFSGSPRLTPAQNNTESQGEDNSRSLKMLLSEDCYAIPSYTDSWGFFPNLKFPIDWFMCPLKYIATPL